MRWMGVLALVVVVVDSAPAGELVFKNGTRITGELSSDMLMLSTGAGVVEILPGEVSVLTSEEIRLKDGRVLRGTLLGGNLRARTALGELGVKVDDLQEFRVDVVTPQATAAPVTAAAAPVRRADLNQGSDPIASEATEGPRQVLRGGQQIGRGVGDAAKGVGNTVVEGAGLVRDRLREFGGAIRDAMKAVGRAAQNALRGS